jgi:hypothetical protein
MGKQTALLVLILCVSTFSQVEASAKSSHAASVISQKPNTPSPFAVGNFFSASAAAAVKPSVEKRAGPKDAIGQALADHNPTLEQVRLIPSLDGPQRKQVNDLFNVYRSDLKLLNEQLRPLREEFKSRLKVEKEKLDKEKQDRQKLALDKTEPAKIESARIEPVKVELPKEEDDSAIAAIVDKIKVRQIEFTQALSKIVSPAQMLELEQLKRGKVPAYAQ